MINRVTKWLVVAVISIWISGCTATNETRPNSEAAYDPKAAEINMRLGLNYLQRGDYEIALGKLEKALQQDPNLASAHNTIALLYQRLEQDDKAEYHFKQAVQLDPTYSSAHNNYGAFLCGQKRYDEAEHYFLESLKNPLYDGDAQTYENAGMCAYRIPDHTLAEEYFLKALQMNPNLSKALLKMAKLRFLNVDYEGAHSYIQRYEAVSNWTPSSLLTAIQIENKLNDQNAVASHTLLLKGKFPDSDEAQLVKRGQY